MHDPLRILSVLSVSALRCMSVDRVFGQQVSILLAVPATQALVGGQLLDLQDAVDHLLRTWWAAGDVDINRNDPVDAL